MAIEKWVDLSGLPKKMHGKREVVDWELVNNHKIPFEYKGNSGTLSATYSHKEKRKSVIKVAFEDREAFIRSGNLTSCKIGAVVNGKPKHYEINDITPNNSLVVDKILMDSGSYYQTGYILKCLETNNFYEMEHHNIKLGYKSPYTTSKRVYEGNWFYAETHLHKYLKNPEDAKHYTKSSNQKIDCVCPSCGEEKKLSINFISRKGFSCHRCSTKTSYPEKLMNSLLEMNNVAYESEKVFKELGDYRYDFYLKEQNLVIETHGEQHYEPRFGEESFAQTQKSDLIKKQFCESQNITYIEIDARKSELQFILNSVNSNESLKQLLVNQDLEQLQELIQEKSSHKDIKQMLTDRENGMTYTDIGAKYGYTMHTARNIIKRYTA